MHLTHFIAAVYRTGTLGRITYNRQGKVVVSMVNRVPAGANSCLMSTGHMTYRPG